MSNALCISECKTFCKSCILSEFWKNRVKEGRPEKWIFESEKTVKWQDSEKKDVFDFAFRLPTRLEKTLLTGIFRMDTSVEIINPATTSEDGKFIVMYNRAFGSPFWKMEDVLTHEIGHSLFLSLNQKQQSDYKRKFGWTEINLKDFSSSHRKYITSRAQDSVEEDFSENLKYFLLDRPKLKDIVPKAHQWFTGTFSSDFKLKESCYEK